MTFKQLLGFCAAALLVTSCGSVKNIAYLQDALADEVTEFNAYTNIIKPGDLLSIVVSSSKPELAVPFNLYSVKSQMSALAPQSGQIQQMEGYTVNPEGYIDFPTLGRLDVAGMTRNELGMMLKEKLMQYMPDPIVTINYMNFNITVLGEVAKPGIFNITSDRVSILDALGMAGDMTEFGNREDVIVIRENNGVREIGRLNIKSKKIFESPYFYLQQNDVVCVDPIQAKARQVSSFQMNFPTIVSLGTLASSIAMLIFYIGSVSAK